MLMAMKHNGEKRCPFCMSRRLKVVDYELSTGKEIRFGKYKFTLKCNSCKGVCLDINSLDFEKKEASLDGVSS